MAIKRREVRSIVILSLKGRFYGDAETDELEKAILAEASAGNKMLVLMFLFKSEREVWSVIFPQRIEYT